MWRLSGRIRGKLFECYSLKLWAYSSSPGQKFESIKQHFSKTEVNTGNPLVHTCTSHEPISMGLSREQGKILGLLQGDNGKENGNYYILVEYILGL